MLARGLSEMAQRVASEAHERMWVEAASARQAIAARAETAQQGVAQMLLAALVAEEAQTLAAEANAAVCADRARAERARDAAQLATRRRTAERTEASGFIEYTYSNASVYCM